MKPQWTPEDISLARRIVALGLPMPTVCVGDDGIAVTWDTVPPDDSGFFARRWTCEPEIGDTIRPFGIAPSAGLLFACVLTDTGPELLPVLTDFALLGWLYGQLRQVWGPHAGTVANGWEPVEHVWAAFNGRLDHDDYGQQIADGATEVEALTAALEAAKAGA